MEFWKEAERRSNAAGDVPAGAAHDKERLQLVNLGLEAAEKCFSGPAAHSEETLGHCYKWRSVLRSKWGDMQGTADKIRNSYEVRNDAIEACKRLPQDSVANHVLGAFYFHIANLSWIERNVASAVFHTVPSHTFDESLPFLQKAQAADPTFIRNALMLGDTLTHLKRPAEAKGWYERCSAFTPSSAIEEPLVAECRKKAGL
eukprot:TRINITY_DN17495_c0_g2_i1.p1 TRINITY_DN17495_c0_g2~~TRINITY_DN17495_c0_g2_i1.p1  ORF type:complete len:202 (+),score=84.19 TRINITY_DN17495_c0_g2_i1:90-695(+)